MADPNQLEMALLNLAVNGRDAMPDGGTLSIAVGGRPSSMRRTKAEAGALRGADRGGYRDGHGRGDVLERAIEPFFSTKGVGEGHRPRTFHGAWARSRSSAARCN